MVTMERLRVLAGIPEQLECAELGRVVSPVPIGAANAASSNYTELKIKTPADKDEPEAEEDAEEGVEEAKKPVKKYRKIMRRC